MDNHIDIKEQINLFNTSISREFDDKMSDIISAGGWSVTSEGNIDPDNISECADD